MELNFDEEIDILVLYLTSELKDKLRAQGHIDTRRLISSIDYQIKTLSNRVVAEIYMLDYYTYLEDGVTRDKIPYSRNSGNKNSKYIEQLTKWWQRKGKSKAMALRLSFATANAHLKEGNPTRNAYRFSKDGTRTGFLQQTISKNEDFLFNLFERKFGTKVELLFTDLLNKYSKLN
jgi:hypothetical protein